jgi:hypothetical protein
VAVVLVQTELQHITVLATQVVVVEVVHISPAQIVMAVQE